MVQNRAKHHIMEIEIFKGKHHSFHVPRIPRIPRIFNNCTAEVQFEITNGNMNLSAKLQFLCGFRT